MLTFEGCPHCGAARDLVETTVRELHLHVDIEAVLVKNDSEARHYHFLGSPSIQVDGLDIERNRRNDEASFACRLYRSPSGVTAVPPRELLVEAIREAQRDLS